MIRQPYLTDKLKIILKDNSLHCLYLNDWDMAVAAFTLQCPEAKVSKLGDYESREWRGGSTLWEQWKASLIYHTKISIVRQTQMTTLGCYCPSSRRWCGYVVLQGVHRRINWFINANFIVRFRHPLPPQPPPFTKYTHTIEHSYVRWLAGWQSIPPICMRQSSWGDCWADDSVIIPKVSRVGQAKEDN